MNNVLQNTVLKAELACQVKELDGMSLLRRDASYHLPQLALKEKIHSQSHATTDAKLPVETHRPGRTLPVCYGRFIVFETGHGQCILRSSRLMYAASFHSAQNGTSQAPLPVVPVGGRYEPGLDSSCSHASNSKSLLMPASRRIVKANSLSKRTTIL